MNRTTGKHGSRSARKLLPLPLTALIDVVLAGAALCVFALFHHVLPQVSGNQGTAIPRPAPTAPAETSSGGTASGPEGWAAKWPDKFSDTVVKTEDSYRSRQISVTMKQVTETRSGGQPVVYMVADIYVNRIDNLKTGLAKDKFGQGLREGVPEMAERANAVVAINGDYYGNRTVGPVVRNGLLYRESPFEDVCVLYADGVMETYGAEELDMEQAKARGAYQVWSFGPRLLDAQGKAMTSFVTTVGGANPRSAIGYYEPGHYCLVLVDGRQKAYSTGMTMSELSALFESLGCKAAYNLDGGQSSVMTFDGRIYNQPAGGGRYGSDILYIAETEE